ncbi:cytochrome P450 [Gloeopeniophorella convolvens]|nr:cytochrome P450 [Gloeopeniophorella convolvens]
MNTLILTPLVLVAACFVVELFRLRRRNALMQKLQGPESKSFWFGNDHEIRYQKEVGDCEFEWMRRYGGAWRRSAPLGEEWLMVTDPKALQHILHTSGYHYQKGALQNTITEMISGNGIVRAHGETHQRQRKIMNPAFSAPQLRSFLPLFQDVALKLVQKWKDEVIPADPSGQPLVNVTRWFSRTTLDIIGGAGFDFQFGSLDNVKTSLSEQYQNLFIDSTLYPSNWDVLFKATWRLIPESLLSYVRYLPSREYSRFRRYLDFTRNFAREIIQKSIIKGDGKDIMSVLLRANASEDPKSRMSNDELVDQVSTLLLAGHDTTSNSLSWFFYEIAQHPESQQRIREEIAAVRERNKGDITAADLDSMTYTQAALKESMRLNPIIWLLMRVPSRDDVIPLAFPITGKSGEQMTSIPIRAGTPIVLCVSGYNRHPEVWGEDAHKWNPERFLSADKTKQTSVGVFANLLNFSGGLRGCIGWRFSILEMQMIAITLLENFEFSMPPPNEKTRVYRKPSGIMMPMCEGERGVWLGLVIKALN